MPIYQRCFELISTYVYGGVASGSYEEIVCSIFSTGACLFVMCIPFLLVYFILRFIISCIAR